MPMFRHSGQPWRRLCECASTSAARQSFVLHEATPRACVCTHELFSPSVEACLWTWAHSGSLSSESLPLSFVVWAIPPAIQRVACVSCEPQNPELTHNLLCMMSAAARIPADQTSRSWAEPAHTNSGRSAQSPWPDRASLKHASELLFL